MSVTSPIFAPRGIIMGGSRRAAGSPLTLIAESSHMAAIQNAGESLFVRFHLHAFTACDPVLWLPGPGTCYTRSGTR
jgi:hypothetical protein